MRAIGKDNLIVLAIVAGLALTALLAVYLPQNRKLQSIKSAALSEQTRLDTTAAQAANVPDLLRHVSEMRSRYSDFDRRLPRQQELGGFLKEISADLAREKFIDQVIEPGSPTREEVYHTLPIIVRFQGSYLALGDFLSRVDKMQRLTRVQRLVVTPPADDKDREKSGELRVELQMNIYFTES